MRRADTDPLTDDELAAMRARCDAATPGPWTIEPHGTAETLYSGRSSTRHGLNLMSVGDGDANFSDNKNFIAAARTDVPSLLAEVDRLRTELELLRVFETTARAAADSIVPRMGLRSAIARLDLARDAAELRKREEAGR